MGVTDKVKRGIKEIKVKKRWWWVLQHLRRPSHRAPGALSVTTTNYNSNSNYNQSTTIPNSQQESHEETPSGATSDNTVTAPCPLSGMAALACIQHRACVHAARVGGQQSVGVGVQRLCAETPLLAMHSGVRASRGAGTPAARLEERLQPTRPITVSSQPWTLELWEF